MKRREERELLQDVKGDYIMHVGDWYHKRASMVSLSSEHRNEKSLQDVIKSWLCNYFMDERLKHDFCMLWMSLRRILYVMGAL